MIIFVHSIHKNRDFNRIGAVNFEDIYSFSVDILEVVLLTRSARTAGTTSATTNAVRCDFSAQRLGP